MMEVVEDVDKQEKENLNLPQFYHQVSSTVLEGKCVHSYLCVHT